MNKDQVAGKVKDVTGRAERQVGEWTGDTKTQVDGAAKQVEGKVQNAWGNVKEAGKNATDRNAADKEEVEKERDEDTSRRKAS